MRAQTKFGTYLLMFLAILSLALQNIQPAQAAATPLNDSVTTWYVATTGNDTNTCLAPATPCKTIQAAVNKASTGNTILVAEGIYTRLENSEVIRVDGDKSLIIEGGWDPTFAAQTGFSVVDGEKIYSGILVAIDSSLNAERFVVQNSSDTGIKNAGVMTLNRFSVHNNSGEYSGGIFNDVGGILSISNSTISDNTSDYGASGVYSPTGTTLLNYVTVSYNDATHGIGGIRGQFQIKNSLIANNTTWNRTYPSDCSDNTITSLGHNLIGGLGSCTITPTTGDQFNLDAKLGFFLPQQGFHPLTVDSPAKDMGDDTCDATDQRGANRVNACDVGAFEYTSPGAAAKISVVQGDGQFAYPGGIFQTQFIIAALDDTGSPVSGTPLTMTFPESGPSGTFSATGTNTLTLTTNNLGVIQPDAATASNIIGRLVMTVSSTAISGETAELHLEIINWYVSPMGSDENSCKFPNEPCATLQGVVDKFEIAVKDIKDGSIYVAEGVYTTDAGTDVVRIMKYSANLLGGWDPTFTTQTGYSTIDGQGIRRGIYFSFGITKEVNIERFRIINGHADEGGGIMVENGNTVRIGHSIIAHNSAQNGGGIANDGVLIINNSGIFDNSAEFNGGGINNGTLLEIRNTTIAKNQAIKHGGGIYTTDATILNNVTITENLGEGIHGSVKMSNSIHAKNILPLYNGECPLIESLDYNLIEFGFGCGISNAGHDIFDADPELGPFVELLGMQLLSPASPAIDMGNPKESYMEYACQADDQRGVTRPVDGPDADNIARCDMGAVEYTQLGAVAYLAVADGSQQLVTPGSAATKSLKAAALDANYSVVPNVSITFTAPTSGPSGIFAATGTNSVTVSSGSNGLADSSTFKTNTQYGDYTVVATAAGIPAPAEFILRNGTWYVAPSGSDSNDCQSIATACATINGVIQKPKLADHQMIRMQAGEYPYLGYGVPISIARSVHVSGGWDPTFRHQTGASVVSDHIYINSPISNVDLTVKISRLSVRVTDDFRGISNHETLIFENGSVVGSPSGGIENYGDLTLINSTISDNLAYYGGGIMNGGTSANLTLINSTVTNNTGYVGGGIFNGGVVNGTVTLINSIVVGNNIADIPENAPYAGHDCNGKVISQGYNIVGNVGKKKDGYDTFPCDVAWSTGDTWSSYTYPISAPSIGLSPLTYLPNGVAVAPLTSSSYAIDIANPLPPGSPDISACPITDQRGLMRPQGEGCDIGAYEYGPDPGIFLDVPQDHWAWKNIESIYNEGITGGCLSSPLMYCPNTIVTRAQMAIFLERGMNGPSFVPPDAVGGVFHDIPAGHWAAKWIEQLATDSITGGCGNGNYCPNGLVTREQMAVFLLRAKYGPTYDPPAVGDSTGFNDVPVNYWAATWIKQLAAEGITSGCGGGNFCPLQSVTRAQMAVFLQVTFGLPLP